MSESKRVTVQSLGGANTILVELYRDDTASQLRHVAILELGLPLNYVEYYEMLNS